MRVATIVYRLRHLHRGYQLGFVLMAAWAPFVLARAPFVAAAVMGACTVVFLIATRELSLAPESTAQPPIPLDEECTDAQL